MSLRLFLILTVTISVFYLNGNVKHDLKKGEELFFKNELDSSFFLFKRAFLEAKKNSDTLGLMEAFKGIMNVKRKDEDFRDFQEFLKVFNQYRSSEYEEMMTRADVVLGMYYMTSGEYEKCISILDSSFAAMDTSFSNGYIGAALLSCKGDAHNELKQFEQAYDAYDRSISIFSKLKIQMDVFRVKLHIAILKGNEGDCASAIKIYQEVLTEIKVFDNPQEELFAYNNMADCYNKISLYDSAKLYYVRAAGIARQLKLRGTENHILKNLSNASENAKVLAEQKVENRSLQRNIMVLVAVFVLVLAITIFVVFRGRLKRQRLIQEQDKLLHQQQITELLQEQEISSINAEMDGMREERDRVAKDLHDRLGGMMGALRIQFDHVAETIGSENTEVAQKMEKATVMLNESVGEIRKVAHNMASAAISEFGFEKAVAKLVERIAGSSALKINFIASGHDFQFKSGVEMELYKIIQELISNILKHANANDVHIESSVNDGEFQLMVEDDGVGFNVPESSKGLGINSVRQRVDKLKGKLIYDSSPGNGTTVIVEVPI